MATLPPHEDQFETPSSETRVEGERVEALFRRAEAYFEGADPNVRAVTLNYTTAGADGGPDLAVYELVRFPEDSTLEQAVPVPERRHRLRAFASWFTRRTVEPATPQPLTYRGYSLRRIATVEDLATGNVEADLSTTIHLSNTPPWHGTTFSDPGGINLHAAVGNQELRGDLLEREVDFAEQIFTHSEPYSDASRDTVHASYVTGPEAEVAYQTVEQLMQAWNIDPLKLSLPPPTYSGGRVSLPPELKSGFVRNPEQDGPWAVRAYSLVLDRNRDTNERGIELVVTFAGGNGYPPLVALLYAQYPTNGGRSRASVRFRTSGVDSRDVALEPTIRRDVLAAIGSQMDPAELVSGHEIGGRRFPT
ncbi:MAG TPA: hypothetical protein VLE99_06640 [Candidatus Saccharimonadales bacterium]|nr:hypothetical protein [Candidatus Saccharimonadales bacterium]